MRYVEWQLLSIEAPFFCLALQIVALDEDVVLFVSLSQRTNDSVKARDYGIGKQ